MIDTCCVLTSETLTSLRQNLNVAPRRRLTIFFTQNLRSQIAKMKQKLNIDHVFSHIGEMGPQQIRYLVLMSVMTMYSPQFMIQVNQTRQSFIKYLMYIPQKMSQFDHFQKLSFIILVCAWKITIFSFYFTVQFCWA